jgi:hypothetical protein
MSHIEFLRDIEGNLTASGLQLVRYTTPERLNAIMQIFRDNDVKINNPHVLQVEDGKQGVIRPDVVAVKQSLDPAGLLNPGKLRGWALRDQLELDSNPLARATRKAHDLRSHSGGANRSLARPHPAPDSPPYGR